MQEILIPMKGLQGYQKIEIPSNYQYEFKFITIINITDNSVCLYPANITQPQAGASIICSGQYSSITIPLSSELVLGFNVVWTNPTASNLQLVKTAKIIFSAENLNYNSSFAPSFTSGGDVINTAVVADDVGLAKEATLTAAKDLINTLTEKDFATSAKQDALLSKDFATSAKQDALLTALNDVVAKLSGFTWQKVTAAAAGDVIVKNSPGDVAVLIPDASESIQLKDGANLAWKSGAFQEKFLLHCLNSIVVNFAAAGNAWILFR